MAQHANTEFKNNDLASDYHRVTGKYCYGADIDTVITATEDKDNMFTEFKYENGKPKPIAIVDWKMPGISLSDKYSAIQLQIVVADMLQVPFFFLITYLGDSYQTKMYYIIPANKIARDKYFGPLPGTWLTLRQYSKFQHTLRDLKWNPAEQIDQINSNKVGLKNLTLGDLPNIKQEYKLPKFEFSWMAK